MAMRRALLAMVTTLVACNGGPSDTPASGSGPGTGSTTGSGLADVTAVAVSGDAGGYTFNVTITSPDSGCDAYADWWEVVSTDGALIYRRILLHSHVDEQPFTRSGGPVDVQPDDEVYVRAHFSRGGYGGAVLQGTPEGSFSAATVGKDFAAGLVGEAPLPDDCAF